MEEIIPNRLAALGHPQRLALFRLLMRRYPDRVPASELARALGLKPNTLSTYVNALMQVGLITQERRGTSLRYAADIATARMTMDYLLHDCCRGRPEICGTGPEAALRLDQTDAAGRYNVLFICTGNSTRSILAEAILRNLAGDRFAAFSAGTQPRAAPNPVALDLLQHRGHAVSGLRTKNVSVFQGDEAPTFDFVFTVCNQAANADSPAWHGQTMSAHWGLPDRVTRVQTETDTRHALDQTYQVLRRKLADFVALPLQTQDRISIQMAIDEIGRLHNVG